MPQHRADPFSANKFRYSVRQLVSPLQHRDRRPGQSISASRGIFLERQIFRTKHRNVFNDSEKPAAHPVLDQGPQCLERHEAHHRKRVFARLGGVRAEQRDQKTALPLPTGPLILVALSPGVTTHFNTAV